MNKVPASTLFVCGQIYYINIWSIYGVLMFVIFLEIFTLIREKKKEKYPPLPL
jgi:hypothetical protein